MLTIRQDSNVGRLKFQVNEETREVTGTCFLPATEWELSRTWVELPFLDNALSESFTTGKWESRGLWEEDFIGDALSRNQIPLEMYGVVYNNLRLWGSTPESLDHAREYISMLLKELAQRALAFNSSLLRIYGYSDTTEGNPRVGDVDVYYSLTSRGVRVSCPGMVGWVECKVVEDSDNYTFPFISMELCRGLQTTQIGRFWEMEDLTEKSIVHALCGAGMSKKKAKRIAAAACRMILVDPDRFRLD